MNLIVPPVLLVAFGAAVMAVNIVLFFSLADKMNKIQTHSKKRLRFLLLVYLFLLLFFLCGYIAVGLSFLSGAVYLDNFLVALIFLFGSLFVLLGILMQRSLSIAVGESNLEIMQALIGAVEARDPNLNGHSRHVERLTMVLYDHLPRQIRLQIDRGNLEYAAMLHDIGKLGVSEAILHKSSALTDEEWSEIKKHPLIGKNILASLPHLKSIADWVLYHHERCDGKGYYGVAPETVPLASRLIAVADTYSAITMTRSYRNARTHEEATAILRECRGTQLDADLVNVFLSIPAEEIDACMPTPAELISNAAAL